MDAHQRESAPAMRSATAFFFRGIINAVLADRFSRIVNEHVVKTWLSDAHRKQRHPAIKGRPDDGGDPRLRFFYCQPHGVRRRSGPGMPYICA